MLLIGRQLRIIFCRLYNNNFFANIFTMATQRKKSHKSAKSTFSPEPVVETGKKNLFKKRFSYKYLVVIVALFVLGGLLYLKRSWFIAAVVDGRPITRIALDRELEKQGGKQTLDDLVTKELIAGEAKKAGVTVSNDEIQAEINKISDQLKSQGSTLDAALSMQGTTIATLEENIKIQKTVESLLKDKLVVSDADVKAYFDQNKESYGKDPKFDDLKDQIKSQLSQQKLTTEFKSWMDKLKSESGVTYFVNF